MSVRHGLLKTTCIPLQADQIRYSGLTGRREEALRRRRLQLRRLTATSNSDGKWHRVAYSNAKWHDNVRTATPSATPSATGSPSATPTATPSVLLLQRRPRVGRQALAFEDKDIGKIILMQWPVTELQLGNVTYTQQQLLDILHQPVRGNGLADPGPPVNCREAKHRRRR